LDLANEAGRLELVHGPLGEFPGLVHHGIEHFGFYDALAGEQSSDEATH